MNIRFSTCQFLGLLLAAGLVSGQAMGQDEASAEAEVKATILAPIVLANNNGMSFGNIFATANGGVITLTPAATPDRTESVTGLLSTNSPSQFSETASVSSAKFTVTGEVDATYTVSFDEASVTLGSAGNTMTVNDFTTNLTDNAGALTDGSQEFYVGAALTVEGSQAPGDYTGTFDVTVNYN
jgi:hypothetical protein